MEIRYGHTVNVPFLPEAGTGSLAYDSDKTQFSSQEGQNEAGAYTEFLLSCSTLSGQHVLTDLARRPPL